MMTETWAPATFLIAVSAEAPVEVSGYAYRGLGLHLRMQGSPKRRRPPSWALTHLGTGHRVCLIDGKVAQAFPIATEIAECSDWDFDGLTGWLNRDPELPKKVGKIIDAHPKCCRASRTGSSEEQARAIAMAHT